MGSLRSTGAVLSFVHLNAPPASWRVSTDPDSNKHGSGPVRIGRQSVRWFIEGIDAVPWRKVTMSFSVALNMVQWPVLTSCMPAFRPSLLLPLCPFYTRSGVNRLKLEHAHAANYSYSGVFELFGCQKLLVAPVCLPWLGCHLCLIIFLYGCMVPELHIYQTIPASSSLRALLACWRKSDSCAD